MNWLAMLIGRTGVVFRIKRAQIGRYRSAAGRKFQADVKIRHTWFQRRVAVWRGNLIVLSVKHTSDQPTENQNQIRNTRKRPRGAANAPGHLQKKRSSSCLAARHRKDGLISSHLFCARKIQKGKNETRFCDIALHRKGTELEGLPT